MWLGRAKERLNCFLFVCLFVCMLVCLFVCLSVCLFVCLFGFFVCLFVCLFICLSVYLFVCLSVCLFVCLFVSVCYSICLSVCLFLCLSHRGLSVCLFVCSFVCLYLDWKVTKNKRKVICQTNLSLRVWNIRFPKLLTSLHFLLLPPPAFRFERHKGFLTQWKDGRFACCQDEIAWDVFVQNAIPKRQKTTSSRIPKEFPLNY